jgi:hypothetical protein
MNQLENPEAALAAAARAFEDGEGDRARADLLALMARHPGWVKGYSPLAQLRWQLGDTANFTQDFESALDRDPKSEGLWIAYFEALMRAHRHSVILAALDRARTALGARPIFDRFEAVAAGEAGDALRADTGYAKLPMAGDTALQLAYLRHLLRARRFEDAARLGEEIVAKPDGRDAWSYRGTAWRLLNDPRWRWLEAQAGLVATADVDIDLDALAALLRRLHVAQHAPFGQTIRHGTQTYGQLLDRTEPEIVNLRAVLEACIGRFVQHLPPPDAKHPLLGPPRGELGFTGSWSVRLTGAGYHTHHTHPEGWISSAFYVVLPESMGSDEKNPAGWLALGQPPTELGLGLPPLRLIRPRPGRLALFPSTMWHGTLPFAAGERLTVAFDVQSR